MYYVPLWLLAACLPVSALAIYLGLRETGLCGPLLYVLSAALSPILLLGTAFAAVVATTALEEPIQAPQNPAPQRQPSSEPTSREPTSPADNPEPTVPEATQPAASPSASPSASASATASPSADR